MVAAPWPYDHAGPLVYEEPEAVLLDNAANAITELLDLCKAEKERDDALETLQNAIITGKAEIFKDYKDQLEDCMARALKIFARPGDPNGFCGLTQECQPLTLGQLRGIVNPTPVWWDIAGGMWCLACRGSVTPPSGRVYNAFEMPGLFYPYPPGVGAVPATLQTQMLRLFSANSGPHKLTLRIEKDRMVFLDGDKVVGTLGGHEWGKGAG